MRVKLAEGGYVPATLLLAGLVAVGILFGFYSSTARAQSSAVQLTFVTLTAPHAALGAPIQWTFTTTNTGTTTISGLTISVNLVAPDGTSFSLFSSTGVSLIAGRSTNASRITTTSTLTSQTGIFQLTAQVTRSGTVLASQTIPVTIIPVPSTGVYVSVGGLGPANTVFGVPTTYKIVTANLSAGAQTLKTNSYLIMPDGTRNTITLGAASSFAAGANTITNPTTINTAVWSAANGNFSVLVSLLDTNNNILSTDTYTFARNPLPATSYLPTFTDTAAAAGITLNRMMMKLPAGCMAAMPGGSGAAVADYDGDGFDDIFLIDMMGMGTLYRNNGNGTFTDMTAQAGIPMIMNQSAALWGDVDNDGRPDLLILTFNMDGTSPTRLLHNNGPNASGVVTFSDVTAASGIQLGTQNPVSATFGDYDNDGFLDLYVTVHLDCTGGNDNDHLFHNNGNGTFTDRTDLLGGSTAAALNRRGLVATFVDYDGDGRVDLYVGNDMGDGNVLWRNDGPGGGLGWIFTDVSTSSGAGVRISDMGIAVLDYNRDGFFDLFNTNFAGNILLQGQSNATFNQVQFDSASIPTGANAHVARPRRPGPNGLTAPAITWGTGAYDFNNDGWEDIFAASGPTTGTGTFTAAFFLNNQDGTFLDVSPLTGTRGLSTPMPTAVFGDFNNDGFMDFLVFGMTGAPQLFMNNARSNGNPFNWLEVKLVGGCTSAGSCTGLFSNHDAIGARLVASVGGAKLWRTVVDGATYQGNNTLIQHFGLGSATQVDSLTINWPSGKRTVLNNVAPNQKITIQEP